jgi:hypothetical protein
MRSAIQEKILSGVHSFMKPIAKFLLGSGVGFREFAGVCKMAFVEVATAEYGIRGRPTNVSRVAVMTGLTRKEVKSIRENINLESKSELPLGKLHLPTQILHYWYNDPDFCDDSGKPRSLPMSGMHPSFTTLVRKYAGDIPPGAMRVELTRAAGVIEEGGMLRPTNRQYIPQDLDEKLLHSMSFSLTNLAATLEHNASIGAEAKSGKSPRFERYVWTTELPPNDMSEFEDFAEKKSKVLLKELDEWIGQREQSRLREGSWSAGVQGAQPTCGVGIYLFKSDNGDVR